MNIQSALELYSRDHRGQYPESVEDLVGSRFMMEMPYNALQVSDSNERPRMQEVSFAPEGSPGDFTYLPESVDGQIRNYWLMVYGRENLPGMDVDGDGKGDRVLYVLGSEDQQAAAGGAQYDASGLAKFISQRLRQD